MSDLLSMRALSRELGISPDTIRRLYQDGVITPEIREGRIIRFDLLAVRRTLRKRAKRKPQKQLPPGMIPVL